MKNVSLDTLLKALLTAQRQVDDITAEIKRRTDGRLQNAGRPRGPNIRTKRKQKPEPRPEEVLTVKEGTC